jgi:ubiquinone/menaquinone biosynthesis C-methylase UbiE
MSASYLMEHPKEAQRLADKVDADAWVATHFAQHIRPGARILDVGCGPAVIAAAVADSAPKAEIVALDASPTRIAVAEQVRESHPNATAILGRAERLPFQDNSFDFVYSRFLLEYLPDKQRAVNEFARVCRPGGIVLLQDLDGQLVNHSPPDPLLEQSLAQALVVLARTGFDPNVGRKLRYLVQQASLTPVRVQTETYHLIAGSITARERKLWAVKLEIAAQAATREGLEEAQATAERFPNYLDRPDTITFSHLFTVTGTKSPSRGPDPGGRS